MFGARTVELIDGKWCTVYNGAVEYPLEDSVHFHVFVVKGNEWRHVLLGRVRWWDGPVNSSAFDELVTGDRHYTGWVVESSVWPRACCPAPHLEPGVWAAFDRDLLECWALEPHMTIKLTDPEWSGPMPLAPGGCFVYEVYRYPPDAHEWEPYGRVAFDLAHLPINAQEYDVRDGVYFSTNRLVLDFDVAYTVATFGKLDTAEMDFASFWSD